MTSQAAKKSNSVITISPEKTQLIKLSQWAKAERESRIAKAKSELEAFAAMALTINDLLLEHYQRESGAKEFKTFMGWKEAGYSVKKGEKSFRIWGKPREAVKQIEKEDQSTAEEPE